MPFPHPLSTDKALQVLQFTDSHLLVHEDDLLKGTATWQTFQAVIEHAMRTAPRPDFVLATGDLVHDGPRTVYRRLREYIKRMGVPVWVLPGNHDDPALLAEVFSPDSEQWMMDNGHYRKDSGMAPYPADLHRHIGAFPISSHEHGVMDRKAMQSKGNRYPEPSPAGTGVDFGHVNYSNWVIIFLNTVVPRTQYGFLSAKELVRLESLLGKHPHSHILLCLHHHPVPFGRAGMDSIGLRNAEVFFSIVDRYPHVRGIVWGHIHNTFEAKRGQIILLGTPSTCFQFDAASERISPMDGPPGYRRLTLEPDGGIGSHVVWL